MEKRTFIAQIECDGITTGPLEIEVLVDAAQGYGRLDIPAGLVGVACNADAPATVRTDDGDEFRILFSKIHFPQCTAEFETIGEIPAGRKVA